MKAHYRSGISYFAPTPPLEALLTVLSMAATEIGGWKPIRKPESSRRMQVSFVDIARAYFNAKVDEGENTYVALPPGDKDHEEKCARLVRHMYGTRAAADEWQEEYSTLMVRLGLHQGDSCPNVFHHPEKCIVCSVHGMISRPAGPSPRSTGSKRPSHKNTRSRSARDWDQLPMTRKKVEPLIVSFVGARITSSTRLIRDRQSASSRSAGSRVRRSSRWPPRE